MIGEARPMTTQYSNVAGTKSKGQHLTENGMEIEHFCEVFGGPRTQQRSSRPNDRRGAAGRARVKRRVEGE